MEGRAAQEQNLQSHTRRPGVLPGNSWYSSAPLRSSRCPSRGRWRTLEWWSCMNHPQHSVDSLCGSCQEHSGQGPLYTAFSGWKLDSNDPSHVQQVQLCKDSGFPFNCSDAAAADGMRGSNVYEDNQWRWQFGHGKPFLGGLKIEETTGRRNAVRDQRHKRGWESRQRCKAMNGAW